jgi:flagellar hook-basal body complex protein FliE
MGYELAGLIHADLARLNADARALAASAAMPVQPAFSQTPPSVSFAQSMQQALHAVDDKERLAAERMADVDSGRSDDLVGAMLASQEASLSFSMLLQVRNKVMGAVEDLIKLPL